MSYSIAFKNKAIQLRKEGYSIKEISRNLRISVSTSSLWLSGIVLSSKAQSRLKERRILGQYNAMETAKRKKEVIKRNFDNAAIKSLSSIRFNRDLNKLLCSIFFWTEGGKYTDGYVYFMNSDPIMISTFMKLLRSSFKLDESKLRALVHIHDYHNRIQVEKFWSDVTNIPLTQFSKSYLKANTKIRIREGYMGCLRVRYYDSKIALELRSLYNTFARNLGVWRNW